MQRLFNVDPYTSKVTPGELYGPAIELSRRADTNDSRLASVALIGSMLAYELLQQSGTPEHVAPYDYDDFINAVQPPLDNQELSALAQGIDFGQSVIDAAKVAHV